MIRPAKEPPTRRLAIVALVLLTLAVAGCHRRQEEPQPRKSTSAALQYTGTIIAMGDSLTAGLGVSEDQAYPALLAKELAARGLNYRVINGGISGETSSGALGRTEWVLSFHPDIVILETGANDGLRGLNPRILERNLELIVSSLQKQGVTVVLCGMEMVRNMGQDYTKAFATIYPQVAKNYGAIFMPFFLAGVAGNPQLNQGDTIHPTADGYRIIVKNLLPYVLVAIKQHETGKAAPPVADAPGRAD